MSDSTAIEARMGDSPEIVGGKALQATWEAGAEDDPYAWEDLTDSERQYWIDWMADVLAALRADGFEIVNLEQTIMAELVSLSVGFNQPQHLGFNVVSVHQLPKPVSLSPGDSPPRFFLVPVGDSPKETDDA